MRTKIIATIGPATLDFDIFRSVIESGASYVRVNTAYGDIDQYNHILDNLKKYNRSGIKVIFDIKNKDFIPYINTHQIDLIAHSFTESAKQLEELRKLSPNSIIISKIETVLGVENFTEILDESDGVMIARGDLGVAATLEKVPCLQKQITKMCIKKNKFVIAATEMLLSMTNTPTPTRAEVSDVANAVFDGVDAVMLSEETAIGKYPVESVSIMKKIIEDAEKCHWD